MLALSSAAGRLAARSRSNSQRPASVIELVDLDIYDVNNAVRHVLDVTDAGEQKAELLAARCRAIKPFIDVRVHETLIGHSLGDTDLPSPQPMRSSTRPGRNHWHDSLPTTVVPGTPR